MTELDNLPILNPARRSGTFLVFDFEGEEDDLPALLEEIAEWVRLCAEYSVDQIVIETDDSWTTIHVTVLEIRPGDVIQQLNTYGFDETAAAVAEHVRELGVREGLRRAGFAYR